MINEKTHFKIYCNSIKLWLPEKYQVIFLSKDEEESKMKKCIEHFKTFTLDVINLKNKKVTQICGMTRHGYFIINGQSYIWPFKEISIENMIYKNSKHVECWTSLINKPWTMYSGRLRLFVNKNILCVEQKYGDMKFSLKKYLELLGIDDAILFKHFESNDSFKILFKELKNEKDVANFSSTFLQHLEDPEDKMHYLCMMIDTLFSDEDDTDVNDISNKRIISTEFFIGSVCEMIDNPKIMNIMIKRIHSNGQYVDRKNYFEYMSHATRVIRGSTNHSCNYEKREIHNSHFGVYCPYRSTEGESIGLTSDLVSGVKILEFEIDNFENIENHKNKIFNGQVRHYHMKQQNNIWVYSNGGRVIPTSKFEHGFTAKQIVFKRHLPPIRISYATTHVRQSVRIAYPQMPIVQSNNTDACIMNGQNVFVAVSSYFGLNIEDAIVINADFISSGGFHTLHTKNFKLNKKSKERFEMIPSNYDIVKRHDISLKKIDENDKSILIRNEMSSSIRITHINSTRNEIRWKQTHIHSATIGDKLSTRSGQKGVIGCVVKSCDLPYNRYGEKPDIIINPAHLPSRMTISQLLESFFGKKAIIAGTLVRDIDTVVFDFHNNQGKEYFWCGKTGMQIDNKIFFGSVFYMALNHFSHKKCRARSKGFYDELTGQPLKCSRNGALRIGEMERDSIIARNSNDILYERFSYDTMKISVCQSCGWLEPNFKCCEHSSIIRVSMSQTTRLMLYELYALDIFPKLSITL